MTYGRSVGKALDTFGLDRNKWPELAADHLAWRARCCAAECGEPSRVASAVSPRPQPPANRARCWYHAGPTREALLSEEIIHALGKTVLHRQPVDRGARHSATPTNWQHRGWIIRCQHYSGLRKSVFTAKG